MAPTRKSKKVNKRFAKVNEEWPDKDDTTANKSSTRKRRFSDVLGSKWSKDELERFYESYRKNGKDWKKVSSAIRNRSMEMVETLYNMNRAYLSLPEGTATAAGLIAMMTDHYNNLEQEGSDSERESNDVPRTTHKPQKRGRGKFRVMSKDTTERRCPDLLQYQSSPSSYGCMSLLKRKRSGDLFAGSGPRVVGKRTPRIPVSNMSERVNILSPIKRGLRSAVTTVDEGVHVAALALAEASQRGGSPHASGTPRQKTDHAKHSPVQSDERKNLELPMTNSEAVGIHMDGGYLEGSIGSREAENGNYARDVESAVAFGSHRRAQKFYGKRPKPVYTEIDHFDDDREACSGTEEGLSARKVKDEMDLEVTDNKAGQFSKGNRKRSRQLFFGDESSALDALHTLADLSVNILLPASNVESESSALIKDEQRNANLDDRPNGPESMSVYHQREKSKILEKKDKGLSFGIGTEIVTRKRAKRFKGVLHNANVSSEAKQQSCKPVSKVLKRKRKSSTGKLQILKPVCISDAQRSESQKMEVSVDEVKISANKIRRGNHVATLPKQGKLFKPQDRPITDSLKTGSELTDTAVQGFRENKVLPIKVRSRRKIDLKKALASKELNPNENAGDDRVRCLHLNNKAVDLKDKLLHSLSCRPLRRWCLYEWFYSAIDYPWFARSEFVEYLNHVRLGHVPRLTRVEWGVIRSSLGKPRRLSKKFLQEEREKLEQYRESVRSHYAELRTGVREGLPTDLARPLSVGQRVIACHPKTREIHDGSILTVDCNRCRVQFDRPELGVEFVMDIDCMPLNPSENMPETLRRQSDLISKFCNDFTESKLDDQPKEWKIGSSTKYSPCDSLDIIDGVCPITSSYPMHTLLKQAKGDTIDAIVQARAAVNEVTVATQQALYAQPCTLAQIQAREADIKALAELARALDKKEALLIELRHMNEEVSETQKAGDPIKDLEHFRKQYAMVLLQLRDANDQVASALLYLRQRNTYNGNTTPTWLRPAENCGVLAGPPGSSNSPIFISQDSGSHVMEVIDNSRRKARALVDTAVKAMCSLNEGEDAFVRIGEALDSVTVRNCGSGPTMSAARYHIDPVHDNSVHQDHTNSYRFEPNTVHTTTNSQISGEANEAQLPLELISSCVATLFMIQNCTERQYPPAEVAQILDSAVSSLQPCCSQNSLIYRDIETCMGIIKNQMLALIPTPTTTTTPLPAEVPIV